MDAKLGDTIANITGKYGDAVQIFDKATNSFKSTYDILLEVSKVWKKMEDGDQALLLEKMAGKQRAEVLGAILNNSEDLTKALQVASESVGSVDKEMSVIMNTTAKKIEQMKNAFDQLAEASYNADITKVIVDSTTKVLQLITSLGGLPPVMLTVLGVMMMIKQEVYVLIATGLIKKISNIGLGIRTFSLYLKDAYNAFKLARIEGQSFTSALKASKTAMIDVVSASNMIAFSLGALVTVVGLLVMANEKAKRKHEEYIQSAKDVVSETDNTVTSIEELKTKYEELSNTKNRSSSQNEQLLSIQKQLNDVLDLEEKSLDASNQTWEERIALIDEATKKELKYAITKQKDVVDDEKSKYDKASKNGIYDDSYLIYDKSGFGSGFNQKENKAFDDLKAKLREKYGELIKEDGDGSIYFDKLKMSAEELNEALEYTHTLMQSEKWLDNSKYQKFASAVNETTGAYKTLTEAQEKQYDMQSKVDMFDLGKSKEDIKNMTEEQVESFKKSFETMSSYQDQSYIDYFYNMVDGIRAENEQLDKLNNTQEKYFNALSNLKNAMSAINTDNLSADNAKLLADSLKTLSDGGKLTYEQFSNLTTIFPELIGKFDACEGSAVDFSDRLEYVQGQIDDFGNNISDLNSAIDSLTEGQTLSADTIVELIRQYPQLTAKVDETTGAWYIEKDALIAVRDQTIDTAKTQKQQEIEKTKSTITQTAMRISALMAELSALQKIASAKTGLEKYTSPSSVVTKPFADAITGNVQSQVDKEKESLNSDLEYLKTLQAELSSINVYSNPKNNSSSSSSKKDSTKDDTKEKYDKLIEQILSSTDEVERAIEVSKQKIETAQLLGDKATEDKEEANIKSLYDKRKKIISDQANQLRALLKTTNDEEIRATIGEKIVDLQNTYHETQISLIEDRIELVKELHEATISGLTDEIDLLNQQRTLMNEDSDEYKATYAKEYGIVLNQQLDTIKAIKDLKAQGYSDESDAVKELKDEWKGYESTRLGIIKSIAEANKQTQLDSLEKSKDGLDSLLEMTMDMIKQRYDDEKEMIQDLIDEREEAVKKEIDGYKALIDAKKKMLEDEQNDRSYQQGLTEKQNNISTIENRMAVLAKDDSDKAKAEYKKLYDELAKAKQELENYQYDKSIEVQQNALDEEATRYEDAKNAELENYKDEKEAELKVLEEYTSKDGKIRQEALELIKGKNEEFYDDLMAWNTEYGDGCTETVVDAWSKGYDAMDKYNGGLYDVLETLKKISAEMESINTAPLSQFVDTNKYNPSVGNVDSVIKNQTPTQQSDKAKQQLNQQTYLHNLMVQAQKDGNKQLMAWIEAERLKWGMDKYGKIIKQYHSGGFVGGLKSNEEFAKLLKGEFVVTDKMQNNFMKDVLPKITGTKSTPSLTLNVDRFMDVDKLDNSTDIKKLSDNLIDNVMNRLTGAYKLKFGM